MFYRSAAAVAVMLALTAVGAGGQGMEHAGGVCTAKEKILPRSLAGWSRKAAVTAAAQRSGLGAAGLGLGQGYDIALHPTRQVKYVAQPEKPGGSVAYGGMLGVSIPAAGKYQISLSSGAWIDVLKDGALLKSSAHAPGPKYSPIRKTVIFLLQPGSYVLQLSANAAPSVTAMLSRVP